jgi:hypothetical protein
VLVRGLFSGTYAYDGSSGVRDDGQAGRADHETAHAAESSAAEYKDFGVVGGLAQYLGGPPVELLREDVDTWVTCS